MVELRLKEGHILESMFSWTKETMVLSFVQGHMGQGWADNAHTPACGKIIVGDFCFLAGNSDSPEAEALVRENPPERSALLVVPEHPGWVELLRRICGEGVTPLRRYAIRKDTVFDKMHLVELAERLPEEFRFCPIDEKLYRRCLNLSFARDFCSNFPTPEEFLQKGLGICALKGEVIVGGASSYSVYDGGIEIEIDTAEPFRRRGIASACAARLILDCLERGLYPSWDAANPESLALAQKLGYRLERPYLSYACELTEN